MKDSDYLVSTNIENPSAVDLLGFIYTDLSAPIKRKTTTHPSADEPNVKYVCKYCGTEYFSDKKGFIPNCKNCGARLEKEE